MKKKIGIVLTVLLVTAACVLSGWLLIGEPVDGKQLAYQITEHPSYLDLQVTAVESAVALRGWQLKQEGNDLSSAQERFRYPPSLPTAIT